MPQIVFVSLFLGLVSGIQPVEVRIGPDVRSVRITIDGKDAATIREPPWKAKINFGNDILPHQVSAIGCDERGEEIARASQIVNLRRPFAEVAIEVKHENATPAAIELIGRHRQFIHPKSARITLDGKRLAVSKSFTARLPRLDWTRPHIISADMRFPDGNVARRELVISGGISYTSGSELTAVVIRRTSETFGKLDGCFSAGGVALRTAAFERTNALVVVVKDPNAGDAGLALRRMGVTGKKFFWEETQLARDSTLRVMFPVAQRFRQQQEESILFEKSVDLDAEEAPFAKLLALPFHFTDFEEPRRVADAVAVAGLETLMPMRRRAVVLVLGNSADHSMYKPATVRRYLAAIGVPLFVWSFSGPRPDLAETWGAVQDISNPGSLVEAVAQLRRVLDEQSIVWVAADSLTALRVKAKEGCGVEVLAGR